MGSRKSGRREDLRGVWHAGFVRRARHPPKSPLVSRTLASPITASEERAHPALDLLDRSRRRVDVEARRVAQLAARLRIVDHTYISYVIELGRGKRRESVAVEPLERRFRERVGEREEGFFELGDEPRE